jgi:two-component system NtrC family sensor kinase
MQREYFISNVFRGLRGLPHFIVAVRNTWKGEPWILRATIDFVAFNNLVENIRIGETGFAFILNRKGEFQTKPHGEIELDKKVFLHFFEARTGPGEDLHVLRRADDVGRENIFVTAFLKNGEWLLVYRQNAADAYSGFRNTLRMTLLAIGIIALGIVVLAFVRWKRINQQLEEENQEREMMNKQIVETGKLAAVGELAAGIAHEINNPVAIMVEEAGWIEDLLEDEEPEKIKGMEEFARALGQIREQGRRCKQITHKLLSFARKTDTRVQEVILYDLVEEMVALSAQRAKYSNVEIRTDLEPGLPSLRVSLSEMQQVFLNLINNALDAMEKTSGTIDITARIEGEMITISVADTGPGIPESNMERMFEPFFTTKPVGKGTGLGLSICYGIITKLGGDIEVHSELGVGTTFRVQIPIQPAEDAGSGGLVDT